MRIRNAVPADTNDIVSLGVEFGEATKHIHRCSVSANKIRSVVQTAVIDVNAVLLVAEENRKIVGLIFGVVVTPFFSDDLVLQEMALYAKKPQAIFKLIDHFEAEAWLRKIDKIVLGSKPAFCNLGKVYKKRKYVFMEDQYIKEIR